MHIKRLLTRISIGGLLAFAPAAMAQEAPEAVDSSFPSESTFNRFGARNAIQARLRSWCASHSEFSDVERLCAEAVDSSTRLEARLHPVIAVDASGQARLDSEVGTANDRFTAEVEIAKADFAELGITRGNGFRDEVVELRVLRGGVLIFSNRLQFSRNLVNDITFETDIRGTAAPELQAGDAARVIVNGHFTLRGRFQLH